jgi:nucleotide sugar dehydrogenase
VLNAADTKWNFLRFRPGLVGGHCIPVDPYYLVYKAQQLGFHPQMITAGRRVNDGMAAYVASRLVKEMIRNGTLPRGASGAVFGLTFKEDVPDTRSSLVKNLIKELKEYGITLYAHDPYLEKECVESKFGAKPLDEGKKYDFILLAVGHSQLKSKGSAYFSGMLRKEGVFFDLKRVFGKNDFPDSGYLAL